MSTQLILYPQNYKGYSSTSSPLLQFLVDGINFSQINSSTSYDATNTPSNLGVKQAIVFQNTTGIIMNTWYRVRSNWTGSPALPLQSSGNLVLDSVSPGSFCGVYQRLSNLVVGAVYNVTVDMTGSGGTALFYSQSFNGTTLNPMNISFVLTILTQVTYTFTAQTPTDIIAFWLSSSSTSSLTITNISITASVIIPTQVFTDLVDGQVICDLYQEEDIPLTLSIDDFKNVAEQVKSYSKDFNLPATKRNNQIFNNMFEVTRTLDPNLPNAALQFNPYVRTKCVLKQDGFILFEGYLRMIDIKDKEGEISYNVNLFSEVIALADILKDATFADLDFTELGHDYNRVQIGNSWNDSGTGITYLNANTSGFRDAYTTLRYPFIDWTHQYIIAASGGFPVAGNPQLTSLEQAFRPCIQLKYLIERIFAASGFNWTSNFFNTTDFGKLYMDFNWGADNIPVAFNTSGIANVDVTQTATINYATIQTNENTYTSEFGYVTGVYTASVDSQFYSIDYNYLCQVTGAGAWTASIRWKWVHFSTGAITYINVTTFTGVGPNLQLLASGTISQIIMDGDTLSPEFNCVSAATHTFTIINSSGFSLGVSTAVTSGDAVTTSSILQTLRGELGQWDFLKGILTMFNLVSLVDESNPDNILIEPYADVFITNPNSTRLDWTDKIDASQMELRPLTDLNKKTVFKFVEDDDDYAFNVFKNAQSGHLYGSLVWDASGFTILEGTEEIIAEPFAATVSKPIDDQFTSFIVPSLYAMGDDGTTEGFDNSPRIFYNNGVKSTGASYYIPAQNGETELNVSTFLQFSHLSDIPTIVSSPPAVTDTRDFVFTSAQLVSALGSPPIDNLYNTYWSPYFNELYNADTRTMTLKVNLSPADVASFKFYDTVFIKNRSFRVNKIEYKPNSLATVEFILIP